MTFSSRARGLAKRFIPAAARRALRQSLADRRLDRAIARFRRTGGFAPGELHEFWAAWGNEGFSADQRFLAETHRLIRLHPGDVLECGTGATTLIGAMLAERHGFHVYSLEQDAAWSIRAMRTLERNRLTRVTVLDAPLTAYGDYMWYSADALALPKQFGVVICDGPFIAEALGEPSYSGWRYGVLPYFKRTARSYQVLLLDDANDARAPRVMDRWKEQFGIDTEITRTQEGDFAIIRQNRHEAVTL